MVTHQLSYARDITGAPREMDGSSVSDVVFLLHEYAVPVQQMDIIKDWLQKKMIFFNFSGPSITDSNEVIDLT